MVLRHRGAAEVAVASIGAGPRASAASEAASRATTCACVRWAAHAGSATLAAPSPDQQRHRIELEPLLVERPARPRQVEAPLAGRAGEQALGQPAVRQRGAAGDAAVEVGEQGAFDVRDDQPLSADSTSEARPRPGRSPRRAGPSPRPRRRCPPSAAARRPPRGRRRPRRPCRGGRAPLRSARSTASSSVEDEAPQPLQLPSRRSRATPPRSRAARRRRRATPCTAAPARARRAPAPPAHRMEVVQQHQAAHHRIVRQPQPLLGRHRLASASSRIPSPCSSSTAPKLLRDPAPGRIADPSSSSVSRWTCSSRLWVRGHLRQVRWACAPPSSPCRLRCTCGRRRAGTGRSSAPPA